MMTDNKLWKIKCLKDKGEFYEMFVVTKGDSLGDIRKTLKDNYQIGHIFTEAHFMGYVIIPPTDYV